MLKNFISYLIHLPWYVFAIFGAYLVYRIYLDYLEVKIFLPAMIHEFKTFHNPSAHKMRSVERKRDYFKGKYHSLETWSECSCKKYKTASWLVTDIEID